MLLLCAARTVSSSISRYPCCPPEKSHGFTHVLLPSMPLTAELGSSMVVEPGGAAQVPSEAGCSPGTSAESPRMEVAAGKRLTLWFWIDFSWKEGSVLTQKKCRNNRVGDFFFFF